MTDPQANLHAIWRAVVDDLLAQSEQPNSEVPSFSHSQRLYLQLVRPIMMVEGYTLVAAENLDAKNVVENELGEYIAKALTRHLGRPCSFAVTLATPQEPQPPATEPSPQAAPPQQQQAPQAQQPQRTEPPQNYIPRPQHSDTGSQPAPAQNNWQSSHAPASLDELAQHYNQQQAQSAGNFTDASSNSARIPREAPAHDPNRETSLNPKHTFDSFVIGSSNRFANGAAVAVAENPARAYNPLFIWGGSGLGKTHLLHAAGNYAQVLHPGLRVKYVSSEEFTNDYINSLRDDRQESFKRRYRNLDILMVDDIQFLEGKESTQEAVSYTHLTLPTKA